MWLGRAPKKQYHSERKGPIEEREGLDMKGKRYSEEQIVHILKDVERGR